jgi:hypothetical protein
VKKDFSETKGGDLRHRRAFASQFCGKTFGILRDEVSAAIAIGDDRKHLRGRLPREGITDGDDQAKLAFDVVEA